MSAEHKLPVARIEGDTIHISALGRNWLLRRAANLEELWEKMGDDGFNTGHIPYWTELWPASLILAEWLRTHQTLLRGQNCLDLGCGLGFTAIAGQWLGARVLACDYEVASLVHAGANAVLNGVAKPAFVALDWNRPAIAKGSMACVWGGDIIYENADVAPVLDFLDWSLAPAGRAWFAEPGRSPFRLFREKAAACGWKVSAANTTRIKSLYPDQPAVTATVWELAR